MKRVYTGLESSGKSLMLSRDAEEVFRRNKRWLEITGKPRLMGFNSPMSHAFKNKIIGSGLRYKEFKNFDEVAHEEEADFFIDELIKFFPANGSSGLSNEQIHFITQGAKSGINIYAASQDFSQVHKQFRLLVNEVYVVTKFIGSKRPMKTSPPVKRIWGFGMLRQVKPSSFRGDSVSMETIGFPSFFTIDREDCERFDTSFKIPLTTLPVKKLRKQIGICEEDGYKKIWYV